MGNFDHALEQWEKTLKNVERAGRKFWKVAIPARSRAGFVQGSGSA